MNGNVDVVVFIWRLISFFDDVFLVMRNCLFVEIFDVGIMFFIMILKLIKFLLVGKIFIFLFFLNILLLIGY